MSFQCKEHVDRETGWLMPDSDRCCEHRHVWGGGTAMAWQGPIQGVLGNGIWIVGGSCRESSRVFWNVPSAPCYLEQAVCWKEGWEAGREAGSCGGERSVGGGRWSAASWVAMAQSKGRGVIWKDLWQAGGTR